MSGDPRPEPGVAKAPFEGSLLRRIHLGVRKPGNWLQLLKFGAVGGSGYVVNLAVFAALVKLGGLHQIPAATGAFAVAVSNNFLLNRYWTFDARSGHAGFQAARFLAVSVFGFVVNLILLQLLVEQAGMAKIPSQAIAVAAAMPLNFIGNKLWTFDD
jgi:dolichol-phosphate mannosyltransferase